MVRFKSQWLLLSLWFLTPAGPGISPIPNPIALFPFRQTALTNLPNSLSPAGTNLTNISSYSLINHPYYVSVSELEWNSKDKQVEISFKLFTDDFEEALRQPGVKTDLLKGDAAQNKDRIQTYIRKHFQIRINDKPVTLQIVGYENDQEATWSYFQTPFPEPPAKIEIANTILYESKKEQVNIVHLKSSDKRKSFRLVNPEQAILWTVGE
jgi:hypothetical protein